ncbi:hypothetical protein PPEP_a2745 [Pseudoalteromonas peptidolytica F12-50-A1]|uniref:Uncharacterized protein n=1 Tax=Pseudoalteromonas peptidolytica F12-50-A1 TaxID=1315280 RepID=A0A8I0MVJ4_9GAMM|nr:hypothetical protein [Pseudoalteromonas peptidolytica F12-50-A1]
MIKIIGVRPLFLTQIVQLEHAIRLIIIGLWQAEANTRG